jgi:flavin-dependent dehydrogenase
MTEDHVIQSNISIIGAGPSGLLTSLWLTKYKTNHILLDSSIFPRQKPCGDNITSISIRCLNEIDPDIIPAMIRKGIVVPIKGISVYLQSCRSIVLSYKELNGKTDIPSCYSVERKLFDAYLMEIAQSSPYAKVITGCHIDTIDRSGNEYHLRSNDGRFIRTRLVIGASGSNSSISKKLGSIVKEDRHLAVGIRGHFKGIQCEDNISELILDKSFFPGAFYITPLPDGIFNVILVIRKDLLLTKKIGLRQLFDQMLVNNSQLKEKFSKSEPVGEFEGSALFFGTQKRRLSGEGYMLAGDAGGLINMITGNGIPQAMVSGKMAAQKAVACLQQNDFSASFMRSYDKDLYKRFKKELSISRIFNPVLSNRIFQRATFFFLNFLATKKNKNSALFELLYANNPLYTLFNPFFYYRLIFKKDSVKA